MTTVLVLDTVVSVIKAGCTPTDAFSFMQIDLFCFLPALISLTENIRQETGVITPCSCALSVSTCAQLCHNGDKLG